MQSAAVCARPCSCHSKAISEAQKPQGIEPYWPVLIATAEAFLMVARALLCARPEMLPAACENFGSCLHGGGSFMHDCICSACV